MVAPDTLHVHGLFSSGSSGADGYSVFTDVAAVLDWEVFDHKSKGSVTVRDFCGHYPGIIRLA